MFAAFDWDVIQRSLPYLFKEGMTFTLTLTALAMFFGIIFGTLLAMMRLSSFKVLSLAAGAYVNLMRSVPLVLVIFWFYFLVPYIGAWILQQNEPIKVGAFLSSVITFTMFEAAYYCEIMRAGIQSIPRGQVWAGYALGLNYWQTMAQRRAAAGVPQHDAGAAHADDHPVPGHFPRVRAVDHRLPRRGEQGRAARRAAGRDVPVRRGRLLHHQLLPVAPREAAAGAMRSEKIDAKQRS